MSIYTPPIENVLLFNTSLFQSATETLTLADADLRYCRNQNGYINASLTVNGVILADKLNIGLTSTAQISIMESNAILRLGYDASNYTDLAYNYISNGSAQNHLSINALKTYSSSIGINTVIPTTSLDINSASGNNLRLINNDSTGSPTYYTDLLTTINGDLTITNQRYTNISNHNGSTKGLQLDGTLITATATKLNYLDITTLGTPQNGKALTIDSGGLIRGPLLLYNTGLNTLGIVRDNNTPITITTSTVDYPLYIRNNLSDNAKMLGIAFSSTSNFAHSPGAAITYQRTNSVGIGDLIFATKSPNDLNTYDRMNILSTGLIGINTSAPDKQLEINNATGNNLRLTYNDDNGTAMYYTDFLTTSTGSLTITNQLYTNISNHNGTDKGLQLGGTLITATAADINAIAGIGASLALISGITPGTLLASKALSYDADGMINSKLYLNHATGDNLRLIYNDSANFTDITTNSSGHLTITPSGNKVIIPSTSILEISNTTAAVSPSTGAIQCVGGIYTGNDCFTRGKYLMERIDENIITEASYASEYDMMIRRDSITNTLRAGICFQVKQTPYVNTVPQVSIVAVRRDTNTADLLICTNSTGTTCSEKIRIIANGYMGINTSNPQDRLDINEVDGYCLRLTYNDTTGLADIYTSLRVNNTGDFLIFPYSSKQAIPTRRVGINTTRPDKILEINSVDGNCLRLTYNDNNGSASVYADLTVSSTGNLIIHPSSDTVQIDDSHLYLQSTDDHNIISSSKLTEYDIQIHRQSSANDLRAGIAFATTIAAPSTLIPGAAILLEEKALIFSNKTSTNCSERMRISELGRIGIGTTAPDKQLEINNSTGQCLRLSYNDSDGAATYFNDFLITSAGTLTITNQQYTNISNHNGTLGLQLGGVLVASTAAKLNYTNITTIGTAEASKCLVLDASAKLNSGIVELNATTLKSTNLYLGGAQITSSATELNYNDITTLGTAEASKCLTLDASAKLNSGIVELNATTLKCTNFYLNTTQITTTPAVINSLTGLTASATELNYNDITTLGTAEASKCLTLDASAKLNSGIVELNATTLKCTKFYLNTTEITTTPAVINSLTGLTASATELNYNDITTLGTIQASKSLTVDSNSVLTGTLNVSHSTNTNILNIIRNNVELLTNTSAATKYAFLLNHYNVTNGPVLGIAFSNSSNIAEPPGAAITHIRTNSVSVGDLVFSTKASTNCEERLRILSTGLIGINTTAPDKQLEINNSTGQCLRLTYDDNSGTATYFNDFLMTSAGTLTITNQQYTNISNHNGTLGLQLGGVLVASTAAKLNYTNITTIGTAEASKCLVLDANADIVAIRNMRLTGNLGIGTTSADKQLEINSSTGACLRLTYNDSNGSATNYSDLSVSAAGALSLDSNIHRVKIGTGTISTANLTVLGDSGTVNSTRQTPLRLFESGGEGLDFSIGSTYAMIQTITNADLRLGVDSAYNSKLTIKTTTGLVGINQDSPAYQLDVGGNAKISGALMLGSSTSTSHLISALDADQAATTSRFISFGKAHSTGNCVELSYYHDGTNSILNALILGFYGYESVRIQRNGYIGIGTASPVIPIHCNSYVAFTFGTYGYLNSTGPTGIVAGGGTANYSAYFHHRVCANEFSAISDKRIKENFKPVKLKKAIDFIKNCEPVKYNYIDESKQNYGYVAQDILKAGFENLVNVVPCVGLVEIIDDDGFVSPKDNKFVLQYNAIIPILHTVIKELHSDNEFLKDKAFEDSRRIDNLTKEIMLSKGRMAVLEEVFSEHRSQSQIAQTSLINLKEQIKNISYIISELANK